VSEDIEDLNNIEFYQEIILEDIIGDLENKCDLENKSLCTNDEDNEEINNKNDCYVKKDKENNGPDTSNVKTNKFKSTENNNNNNNNTSGKIKNDYNYVSGTESDVESNYDTSSDFVPLNVRKLNIKRKLL